MRSKNDKRIANWLGVSAATYYRWRLAGLVCRRPASHEEAIELRSQIDAAFDNAVLARQHGQRGRTSIDEVVKVLESRK